MDCLTRERDDFQQKVRALLDEKEEILTERESILDRFYPVNVDILGGIKFGFRLGSSNFIFP